MAGSAAMRQSIADLGSLPSLLQGGHALGGRGRWCFPGASGGSLSECKHRGVVRRPDRGFRALLGSAECGSPLSGDGEARAPSPGGRGAAARSGPGRGRTSRSGLGAAEFCVELKVCAPRPEDCAVALGLGLKRSELFLMWWGVDLVPDLYGGESGGTSGASPRVPRRSKYFSTKTSMRSASMPIEAATIGQLSCAQAAGQQQIAGAGRRSSRGGARPRGPRRTRRWRCRWRSWRSSATTGPSLHADRRATLPISNWRRTR
jgi:hypothetical protein